jgi:serine/threonine-protein kinase PRP4
MDVMRQAGEKERDTVMLLNKVDPGDRKHIVRLYDSFDFQKHLCLVYELMDLNLRELLTKFGKGVGLSLEAVALYGRQLFTALALLHRMQIIHADLKPDNLMVSNENKRLKLCDLGSVLSYNETETHKTDTLVSPFYRAPEVILGIWPLDGAVDIWSAACTLFELFTGKFMIPATSNS